MNSFEYKSALFPCVNIDLPPFASLPSLVFSCALPLCSLRLFISPLRVSIFARVLALRDMVIVMPCSAPTGPRSQYEVPCTTFNKVCPRTQNPDGVVVHPPAHLLHPQT
ncbi:uncharacterized protein BJ212DRAFT_1044013 [Suillus subaureus]|uniref:Uncharacterized protein n=1 Tax=Suillus subaureus TaxID=48587 RepID=A0A9P7DS90_9AGAM|nr:uncharacterized protein BJ212DRAFT_1044013 [Suillus subaureus]KAG1801889.1 hypothetical protein BJ212DRAFT_1044013 [Suillus subaureus]